MQGLVPYLIWGAAIVTGLSIAMIIGFGFRNLIQGKVSTMTAGILAVPALTIVVLGLAISDSWPEAFITGVLLLLIITAGSLLISSFRMMFGL
jgi:hypothetical protein